MWVATFAACFINAETSFYDNSGIVVNGGQKFPIFGGIKIPT